MVQALDMPPGVAVRCTKPYANEAAKALDALYLGAHSNLRQFCAMYLHHYFTIPEDEMLAHPEWGLKPGWGYPQCAMTDALTGFTLRQPRYAGCTTLILELFRGAGKSTLGVVGFSLWLSCTKRRQFIMIVSDTKGQAVDQLVAVLNELESNEEIRAQYGTLYEEGRTGSKTERKRQDDVTLTNGVRIIARGAGQKLRGSRWKTQRPDCVILDDPQGEDEQESAELAEKLNRWVDRVVIGMLAINALMVVIATPIRHNDIISHMKKKPASLHVRFPGEDEHGTPSDPYRFSRQRLDWLKNEMGPTAYDQEIKLIPAGSEAKAFRLEWMRAWPQVPAPEVGFGYVGWDPSAKLKELNDNTAIVLGRAVEHNMVAVFRCAAAQLPLAQQVDAVVMLAQKYDCRTICVETIAAQEWAKQALIDKLREKKFGATVLSQEHNKDKRLFIETTLQGPIFSGAIRFVTEQHNPAHAKEIKLLQDELCEFPTGGHDDRCDALANMWLAYLHARHGLNVEGKKALVEKYIKHVERLKFS